MVFREIWLVFVRSVRPALRSRQVVGMGLLQPLLYLVLFGPLLHGVAGATGRSWQWFVPGLMVQLALFGTAYAGFALIPEIRSGALERMRVSPVSRAALLLGRVVKDVLQLVVQSALLVVISMIFGFRASVGALMAGFALLAILGIAVGAASYTLALKLKQEYAFAPMLSGTVVPLMLLSGVLLPMSMAPAWLYDISRANPLAHVVDAERAVISGDWSAMSVWLGPLLAVVLAVAGIAWGVRTFRRQDA